MTKTIEKKQKDTSHIHAIEALVIDLVGEVKNLMKIDVISLWSNKYRINVWAKVSSEKKERGKGFYEVPEDIFQENKIVQSFFIIMTPEGPVVL